MTNRTSVHKSIPRALLRWSAILAVCVLLPIALLRLKARDEFYATQAAAFAESERLLTERWPLAKGEERAWIKEAAAYDAERRREYEWASRYPWRKAPPGPAAIRAGD